METQRFTLNEDKAMKVSKNAVIFLAPAVLVFLVVIQSGGSMDEALMALKLWTLNTTIDILRKFISGK